MTRELDAFCSRWAENPWQDQFTSLRSELTRHAVNLRAAAENNLRLRRQEEERKGAEERKRQEDLYQSEQRRLAQVEENIKRERTSQERRERARRLANFFRQSALVGGTMAIIAFIVVQCSPGWAEYSRVLNLATALDISDGDCEPNSNTDSTPRRFTPNTTLTFCVAYANAKATDTAVLQVNGQDFGSGSGHCNLTLHAGSGVARCALQGFDRAAQYSVTFLADGVSGLTRYFTIGDQTPTNAESPSGAATDATKGPAAPYSATNTPSAATAALKSEIVGMWTGTGTGSSVSDARQTESYPVSVEFNNDGTVTVAITSANSTVTTRGNWDISLPNEVNINLITGSPQQPIARVAGNINNGTLSLGSTNFEPPVSFQLTRSSSG